MLLEAESYTVIRASSGPGAIERLQAIRSENFPEILLLDLQMPGLSGSELAERCRLLAIEGTRILAMSATRPPASRLAGYDGFVSKPFSVAAFKNALQHNTIDSYPSASHREGGSYGRDLDASIYDKLAGMMPAARLNEIYAACLSDTIRRIPVMQQSGASGDFGEVRRLAHGIKGGSSMIGARIIASIASELESGQYTVEDVPQLLSELSSACERLGSILLLS